MRDQINIFDCRSQLPVNIEMDQAKSLQSFGKEMLVVYISFSIVS